MLVNVSRYFQIDLIIILAMFILFINAVQSLPFSRSSSIIKRQILLLSILVVCDYTGWVLDGNPAGYAITLSWTADIVYFFLTVTVGGMWMLYTFNEAYDDEVFLDKVSKCAVGLPVAVSAVIDISSYWSHLVFYIDDQGNYIRGELFLAQYLISFVYLLAASAISYKAMKKEKNVEKRNRFQLLTLFPLIPIFGAVIQNYVNGVLTLWPMTAVGFLIVYINIQHEQISMDALTGLNNRRRFNQFFKDKFTDGRNSRNYYLIMIDVDEFKSINDNYGHISGDQILRMISSWFKAEFGKKTSFIARFGGDEFAIILQCRQDEEAYEMLEALNSTEGRVYKTGETTLRVTLSAGGAWFDEPAEQTPEALLALADARMYDVKRRHKREKDLKLPEVSEDAE